MESLVGEAENRIVGCYVREVNVRSATVFGCVAFWGCLGSFRLVYNYSIAMMVLFWTLFIDLKDDFLQSLSNDIVNTYYERS